MNLRIRIQIHVEGLRAPTGGLAERGEREREKAGSSNMYLICKLKKRDYVTRNVACDILKPTTTAACRIISLEFTCIGIMQMLGERMRW